MGPLRPVTIEEAVVEEVVVAGDLVEAQPLEEGVLLVEAAAA